MRLVNVLLMSLLLAACASVGTRQPIDGERSGQGTTASGANTDTSSQHSTTSNSSDDDRSRLLTTTQISKLTEAQAKIALSKQQEEEGQTRKDALADFKKGAGLAISIVLGEEQNVILEAVEIADKITVTRRAKDQPRAALEAHQLFTANPFTAAGQTKIREQIQDCAESAIKCPLIGIGPFAAIQTGNDDSISSAGLGVMVGVRSDPRKTSSFNLGVGVAFDTGLRELAPGFVEGKPLPDGESAVRFTERSARRLMLTLSFAF